MKKISNTVIFFGSGPVAAASLRLLHESFTIEAVITKPRAPHHKGSVPVLEACEELGLVAHTPNNKAELSERFATRPFTSQLGIVIDYGIIINKDVIDYFHYGIVNSHFSLLPEWRGADPITFSILSGQQQTGISLMLINEKMDEGPLLAQAPYDLDDTITTPVLTEDLVDLSYGSLCQILPLYLEGKAQPTPQETATMAPSKEPSYSRKLTKEDGTLDWNKPAYQLEREVRAFIEWPKSHTTLAGKNVTITKAHVMSPETGQVLGRPFITADKHIAIATTNNTFVIDSLKPAGKNEMTVQAFLAGHQNKL
jgi:methionyl-tRNA formyltransferase